MPKTTSQTLLKHYPPLRDIPEDEWDDIFSEDRNPWTEAEDAYVRQWYGKTHILELAYALCRVPWKVSARANKLGIRIGKIGRYKESG